MKGLRHYLNKIKPNFEQGGKYGRFASTFEAFESFLYVPNTVTRKGRTSATPWTSNGL